jgi:hypothetical protein
MLSTSPVELGSPMVTVEPSATPRGSHSITVRIPDQILHRLRQFRLLAAYPKIPPVKVP